MDVKTYFDTKRKMTKYCYKQNCSNECPLHIMNNEMHINCIVLEQDYPEKAEKIIQEYIDNKERILKMNQWWKCPICGEKVDFTRQMFDVFDIEDGEAIFSPESGVWFHTIFCECGTSWVMSISEMIERDK